MRKLNITIVAGLVVALIGAALVVVYGRGVDKRIADGKELVKVYVATADIAPGTALSGIGAQAELKEIPRAYLVAQPLTEIDPASTSVTKGFITAGSQLAVADFGPATTAAAVKPPKGKVNLAVEVALTPGVARYVTAGSTVDMFVTYNDAQLTKLFATAVKVVSVSVAQPVSTGTDNQQQAQTDTGANVLSVLEVDPLLAEKIVNAAQLGKIYLALSAGDPHSTGGGSTPNDVIAGTVQG